MQETDRMISALKLQQQIPSFYHVHCFERLESTNTFLMEHHEMEEGTVILADEQTGGKGRNGRVFHSPKGTGIYLSVLLKPKGDLYDMLSLTAVAAVSCLKAIEDVYGLSCSIKWLNDIMLDGKKIAGILCESRLMAGSENMAAMVVGVGINVHSFAKPSDIANIAASLEEFTDKQKPRQMLVARFLHHFYALYNLRGDNSMHAFYRNHSLVIGKVVTVIYNNTKYQAYAQDVDERYRLLLRKEDGTYDYLSTGEVSIRL